MPLVEAALEPFCMAPIGRYTTTASTLIWCSSPSLIGAVAWGRPTLAETETVIQVFSHYERLENPFAMIIDTRALEAVDPLALAALYGWLAKNREPLAARVRIQASLIERGPIGFLVAGILPAIVGSHPTQVFTDAADAFRTIAGGGAVVLAAEIDELVARVRGVPPSQTELRSLLAKNLELTLERAALDLGLSTRSLQRLLGRHGSSFKEEVATARFTLAAQLLAASDEKLAVVASRVGISERALTVLIRHRTSLSPAEFRRKQRGD